MYGKGKSTGFIYIKEVKTLNSHIVSPIKQLPRDERNGRFLEKKHIYIFFFFFKFLQSSSEILTT